MKSLTLWAPAKVNLYLRVKRKRPDGYHDIETLFERINIKDRITVSVTKGRMTVTTSGIPVPAGRKNICYKAAALLKKGYGVKSRVKIHIEKRIPVAAGLGGGSSDAAGVLKALNRLWKLSIGEDAMMRIAARVGADVPFFIKDVSFARGSGIGDRLIPVKSRTVIWHLVVTPPIRTLSGTIYKMYDKKGCLPLTRPGGTDKMKTPKNLISNRGQLSSFLCNDLEETAVNMCPLIGRIKAEMLSAGALGALVSGSGPSVFAVYRTRKEALKGKRLCMERLPADNGWRVFVARTF
ncbi:MAG: 4-(cytidine 5'-diphospho)-2-C-methyl-D-erythritol kinase [Candidatus Omnitrophota bacterium]